jgi:hypothetical protein
MQQHVVHGSRSEVRIRLDAAGDAGCLLPRAVARRDADNLATDRNLRRTIIVAI